MARAEATMRFHSGIISTTLLTTPAEIDEYGSPKEIVTVKAVYSATKADLAVAARRLQSGDTVVTFKDSASRQKADETEWVHITFGPDAAVYRRVSSVVVEGFSVRLSQNQDREDIRKKLTAAKGSGSGIIRATARKPKGTATRALLIIGVDGIDAVRFEPILT
ncbi:hypothetical protein E4U32_002618 [Claviceps aff. humidiphila group G2b]|nr:hypothetical protein E4U32_002618 [Claviceps aff. humidiphila group G2b]